VLEKYVNYFEKPSYVYGFLTVVDRANRKCRIHPPSPQPCTAWHGYRVSNAHHEEVGVSADWLASAPPSGAAGGCR
jgi:hypothetical protein